MFCIVCFGSRETACGLPLVPFLRRCVNWLLGWFSSIVYALFFHICIMLCGTQGEVCELPVHEPVLLKVNGSPALLIK